MEGFLVLSCVVLGLYLLAECIYIFNTQDGTEREDSIIMIRKTPIWVDLWSFVQIEVDL